MAIRACTAEYGLSQRTLLILLSNNHFLQTVPLSQWTITSFDAKTRIVCITMTSGVNTTHIVVTLPKFI